MEVWIVVEAMIVVEVGYGAWIVVEVGNGAWIVVETRVRVRTGWWARL